MFRGRYEHAIDGKGRTSLPSRFREVLSALSDSRVVLAPGFDPCVTVYPREEWLRFEERLAALPQFDRQVRNLRRLVVSGVVEAEVDKLGRIVVPPVLRKHACLQREVLWAGMGPNMELWDRERFDQLQQELLSDDVERAAIEQHLAELGL